MQRLSLVLWIVAVLGFAAPASASPMVDAYKEYLRELAANDIAGADASGAKALQLAEEAGDQKYTAILAYNLAKLRARYEPGKDAMTPAKRAAELAGQSEGALPVQKANLLLAALQRRNSDTPETIKALKEAYDSYEKAGLEPGLASYVALEKLIGDYSQEANWIKAAESGEALVKSYEAIGLKNDRLLASIHIATGMAYLRKQRDDGYEPAYNHFKDAEEALADRHYPDVPQEYYQAKAWAMASRSLMDIAGIRSHRIPKVSYRDIYMQGDQQVSCPKLEWDKEPKPTFPANAYKRGYVGSAVLIYDIKDDGSIANIRVGAEVPNEKYGERAVLAMERANVKNAGDMPEQCRTNRELSFSFTFRTRKSKGFSRLKKRHLGGVPTKD